MNLYLDDDTADHSLLAMLRRAGHTAVAPADVAAAGASDARHFIHAMVHSLVLLTRNHDDFLELHDVVVAAAGAHPGILIIRSDNDPTRDLTLRGIVTAIGKLQSAGVPLTNQCYILNHWR
jgi:predicted nuclease of predicted toxin-antitoxin system